jgi:MerR family transcriptional regulator, thiopeptide resistance regulator
VKRYQAHEFAQRAGVTVRTLHHYDRLGLLKVTRRSRAGYRLYSDPDLIRLEQIVVLKSIGLTLKETRELLQRDRSALQETLARQQRVLTERRKQMDKTIRAIGAARRALDTAGEPDWMLLIRIIKEVNMQNETDWTKQYYSDDGQAKVDARRHLWSPELQEKVTQQWNELFRDIDAALDKDPASPTAQALLARWRELVGAFTGGDPEIQQGLNRMYADMPNWPEARREQFGVRPEIQAFITKALAAAAKPGK